MTYGLGQRTWEVAEIQVEGAAKEKRRRERRETQRVALSSQLSAAVDETMESGGTFDSKGSTSRQ